MNKGKMIFKQYGATAFLGKVEKTKISHYVKTNEGHSGSPILMKLSEAKWKVVGLHSKYDKVDRTGCGCRFAQETLTQILKWGEQ
jgi:V8-like Glu-specific endopeptidase